MNDSRMPARATSSTSLSSTTSRSHNAQDTESSSTTSTIRPRNRKHLNLDPPSGGGAGLLAQMDGVTQARQNRSNGEYPSNLGGGNDSPSLGQFFNDSWNSSWASLQGLTNSIIAGEAFPATRDSTSRSLSRPRSMLFPQRSNTGPGTLPKTWGPEPPQSQPGLNDVAVGSLAERESALKAARMASVLESHEGVNGGLDIKGNHKRRISDDISRRYKEEVDHFLAYVHNVQPTDSHVGLVLRYRCGEEALKKANGLWSRDSIQTRKWLIIPVDACEVRGLPCEGPSVANGGKVDLLATTPEAHASEGKADYFSAGLGKDTGELAPSLIEQETALDEEGDKPWVHVKWVKLDGIVEPVEIARVSRLATGYFPPRRRKSLHTISSISTPRQSIDASSGVTPGSVDGGGHSSRRLSSLSNRPLYLGTQGSPRSRGDSEGNDGRPAWMRRPGGVGSMGSKARAPGPDSDYLNTWTRKHIPGLNIEGPSMSITGSERARWGFDNDSSQIAETSYEEGREASTLLSGSSQGGIGLDKAAAAVETWLRGALSKKPSTPVLRGRSRASDSASATGLRSGEERIGDLIELADTSSDDGKFMLDHHQQQRQQQQQQHSSYSGNLLLSSPLGASSSRSAGDGNSVKRTNTGGVGGLLGMKSWKGD